MTNSSEPQIKIGSRIINNNNPPFIIAEAGVNHENNIHTAYKMIENAASAGADAIKFQSYKAKKLALRNSPAYWNKNKESTSSQYDLFSRYDKFSVKDYKNLARFAQKCNIIFLTTCFDEDFVNQLDDILPAYKIASADITHLPLIKRIAGKKKPVILSTGAATISEIDTAISSLKSNGCNQIALLHCVLNYPCPPDYANLAAIKTLKSIYPDILIGYSDHISADYELLQLHVAAWLGAKIIEKHFTLNKSLPGNDHYHSMDFNDLKHYKKQAEFIKKLYGNGAIDPLKHEQKARTYARRSLVANKDINKGTIINSTMLAYKRPGTGISPKDLQLIIGAKTIKKIKKDEILKWDNFIKYAKNTKTSRS